MKKNIIKRIHYKIIIMGKKLCWRFGYGKQLQYGERFSFRKGLLINISENAIVKTGSGVFLNNFCSINSRKSVLIGNDCIFGEGVKIYDHNHVFNKIDLIKEQGVICKDVKIGSNCWIGSNVVILAGTSIENNSVVSAGCVVSGDIPKETIVKRADNAYCFEKIIYRGGTEKNETGIRS